MEKNNWQKQRLGKFTASEIYKLLVNGKNGNTFGQTALTYIKEKAAEILTGEAEQISNKAMEWGTLHEPSAISAYKKRYGDLGDIEYYGVENPKFIEHTEFSGGSPDAVSTTHLIEVKCPYRSVNHLENLTLTSETFKAEHLEYYAQIQFNMLLTGKELAHFVSFDPRMACGEQQLAIIEIPADKIFQNIITQRIALAEIELNNLLTKIIQHE